MGTHTKVHRGVRVGQTGQGSNKPASSRPVCSVSTLLQLLSLTAESLCRALLVRQRHRKTLTLQGGVRSPGFFRRLLPLGVTWLKSRQPSKLLQSPAHLQADDFFFLETYLLSVYFYGSADLVRSHSITAASKSLLEFIINDLNFKEALGSLQN